MARRHDFDANLRRSGWLISPRRSTENNSDTRGWGSAEPDASGPAAFPALTILKPKTCK